MSAQALRYSVPTSVLLKALSFEGPVRDHYSPTTSTGTPVTAWTGPMGDGVTIVSAQRPPTGVHRDILIQEARR